MGHRVFCFEHMRMCMATSVLVDETKFRSEPGNIKHWKLKCGCIVDDIENIKVHQGYFLKDGTQLVNPGQYHKWELIPPKVKK